MSFFLIFYVKEKILMIFLLPGSGSTFPEVDPGPVK